MLALLSLISELIQGNGGGSEFISTYVSLSNPHPHRLLSSVPMSELSRPELGSRARSVLRPILALAMAAVAGPSDMSQSSHGRDQWRLEVQDLTLLAPVKRLELQLALPVRVPRFIQRRIQKGEASVPKELVRRVNLRAEPGELVARKSLGGSSHPIQMTPDLATCSDWRLWLRKDVSYTGSRPRLYN